MCGGKWKVVPNLARLVFLVSMFKRPEKDDFSEQ